MQDLGKSSRRKGHATPKSCSREPFCLDGNPMQPDRRDGRKRHARVGHHQRPSYRRANTSSPTCAERSFPFPAGDASTRTAGSAASPLAPPVRPSFLGFCGISCPSRAEAEMAVRTSLAGPATTPTGRGWSIRRPASLAPTMIGLPATARIRPSSCHAHLWRWPDMTRWLCCAISVSCRIASITWRRSSGAHTSVTCLAVVSREFPRLLAS